MFSWNHSLLLSAWEITKTGGEICLLSFIIYKALCFVKGTKAAVVLAGLTTLVVILTVLSWALHLEVLGWILQRMWTFLSLAALIIFQPEVRRALAEFGRQSGKLRSTRKTAEQNTMRLVNRLVDSVFFLSAHRIGALIVIEQEIGLRAFAETGTPINAPVSSKLLSTIFFPNTPLHDGAAILRGGEIAAAGCILPLAQSAELSKSLGTRHRAGVGITEETDAVVLIVSEESGSVSLARHGHLTRGADQERIRRHLTNWLVKSQIRGRGKDGGRGEAGDSFISEASESEAKDE